MLEEDAARGSLALTRPDFFQILNSLLEKRLLGEIDFESLIGDVEVFIEEIWSLMVFELDSDGSEPSSYEPSS